VSCEISDNEFFTLLGPSGCGKTTLLRMIGGFETPTTGTIELHGRNIQDLPAYKRRVNTVFQNYALFPHLSVADNIAFGLDNLRWKEADKRQRVAASFPAARSSGSP
jgi:spermidine/putrescine transport system ATP-binding protein